MHRSLAGEVGKGMIRDVPVAEPVRTAGSRVIQGLLFVGGAGLLEFSAGADRIAFYWTPLIIGIIYLLAAIIDGPRGGYWATALGLTGWGLAVAYMGAVRPADVDVAGAYLVGVGFAGLAAALLRVRGFAISEAGLALTIVGAGAILALSLRTEAFVDATTYAVAVGTVGVLNVAGGACSLLGRRRPSRRSPIDRSTHRAARSDVRHLGRLVSVVLPSASTRPRLSTAKATTKFAPQIAHV